ncbi:MAG: AsnC family transcriptional regulator [Rhizobiaceae bacterium]|nr:AsnC family transcriptional regulator [Rhizobiaceae bacterium]
MDEIDHALLRLLKSDARAPLSNMAARLGVSRGTVRNRIERLVDQKVIERFTVQLSETDLETDIVAFALIRLQANDGRRTLIALRKISGITAIHTLSGPYDLVAELSAPSLKQLDHVLDNIRNIADVAETQSHIKLVNVTGR